MKTSKKDALATTDGAYPLAVMEPGAALDIASIASELGEDPTSLGMLLFTRVKMPSGDMLAFQIENPDDPADAEVVKEIVGVIVAHHAVNAYWASPMEETGGNTAPDCVSPDGVTAHGDRGTSPETGEQDDTSVAHDCASCWLNEFGSSPDGGKACKNRRHLYILREGDLIPLLLPLPATSLKNWRTFAVKSLMARGRYWYGVVTRVGLEPASSASGVKYSKATFSLVDVAGGGKQLPAAQTAWLKGYGESLLSVVTAYTPAIVSATATEAASGPEPF
jgi:hypothetical protein